MNPKTRAKVQWNIIVANIVEGYGHKILHAYSRIYFSDYLRNTLGGVLSEVLKEKSQELRIDPDQSFVDMAIKIIDRIIQAMPELPEYVHHFYY
jgi:hypothetical protein